MRVCFFWIRHKTVARIERVMVMCVFECRDIIKCCLGTYKNMDYEIDCMKCGLLI
jgi:hypothetical protein